MALVVRDQYRLLQMQLTPPEDKADTKEFTDITYLLGAGAVEVEDNAFEIDTLRFVLNHHVEAILPNITKGARVRFKGGYQEGRKEWLFDGCVQTFHMNFGATGRITLAVTCFDYLTRLQNTRPSRITYPTGRVPTILYRRNFHFVDEITLSEIVTGILAEYDIPVGRIDIDPGYDFIFTRKTPICQNEDETDYQFLQRLLTGKCSGPRGPSNDSIDDEDMHGHAIMFMETGGTGPEPDTKIYVLPEDKCLMDLKSHTVFVYHAQDNKTEIVTPDNYTPDQPGARHPMLDISVTENEQDSKAKERLKIQEAPHKKKGGRRTLASPGESKQEEKTKDPDEEEEPPGGWLTWTPDMVAIKAAEKAGVFKGQTGNPAQFLRTWPWAKAKQYFTQQAVTFDNTNRPLEPAPPVVDVDDKVYQDDAEASATGKKKRAAAHSRGAKHKRPYNPMVEYWGITMAFTIPDGNPSIQAKKMYKVEGLPQRYTGDWFMIKVTHKFEGRYTAHIELAR